MNQETCADYIDQTLVMGKENLHGQRITEQMQVLHHISK